MKLLHCALGMLASVSIPKVVYSQPVEEDVSTHDNRRPNILIILADDAGYSDFGFMGAEDTRTPHLDRLAQEGCCFTDAHVAATVSSPSRAMLLTGRYGQRFGYECNIDSEGQGLPEGEELLPAVLQRHGYRTACIGKWHLGSLPRQHPNEQGFDEFYGLIGGSRPYFYNQKKWDRDGQQTQYQHNGRPLSFDGYFTDELTRRAKEFVANVKEPFMMYLSYTAPHSPNQAKPEDLERFEGQSRQVYAAMLYALDRGVGDIVEELKRTGKYDNTLIFFLSDNGGATTNQSSNLPLKGFKGNKFEGGQRVPFVVEWGNRIHRVAPFEGLTSSLDIFPTVLDAVGLSKKVARHRLDGVSLLPYLDGRKKGHPHDVLYWRKMDTRAIRKGDYQLIMTHGVDTVMYHLPTDLSEKVNLVTQHPQRAKQLIKELEQWERNDCRPPLWIEDGWADITNGIHRLLMENTIMTADDLRRERTRNKK